MTNINLRKRNGRWEYRYETPPVNGKRQQHSKGGFKTKKAAQEAALQALEKGQILLTTVPQSSKQTLEEYLSFWMEHYCRINLKSTTYTGYAKRIRLQILPQIGHYTLEELTPLLLQDFINQMFLKGYSRNSLSVLKGILSGSLGYAISPVGILSVNPMQAVRLPNIRAKAPIKPKTKTRTALTTEQWDALLARFPRDHSCHLPLMLGYHLGLRLGETFGLLWEDIDFQEQTLVVRRQVQWDAKDKCWYFSSPKYDSFRTLALDPQLLALLKDELQRQQKGKAYYGRKYYQICVNDFDQLGLEGTPIHLVNVREDGSYIQPRVTQHLNHIAHTQLNLPLFDYHTLRHTHTTMLLEAGANPLDVQARLGHSKLSMTWHYAHNTAAMQSKTREILEKIFC